MAAVIENNKNGFTISFQTRGVDMETATRIWKQLSPDKIEELTKATGHCLCVKSNEYCFEVRKTDWGNYTIWCGKDYEELEK